MIAFLMQSCYNDSEEKINGITDPNACDTLAAVTYSGQMKTLFDNKCNSCHISQFPNFNTYDNSFNYVKDPVNSENLYFTVAEMSHQGASLTVCEKAQLKKWLKNPAP